MLEALRGRRLPGRDEGLGADPPLRGTARRRGSPPNNVTVVKEALASLGLCRRDVRPPSRPLPEAQRAEVADQVAGWSMMTGTGRLDDGSTPEELRSHQWYGTDGLRSFSHRARTRQLGYLPEEHLGKPVIAILNTWSDINPCHVAPARARPGGQARGVAGGRIPAGVPGLHALRDVPEADPDALPQPAGDGDGGTAALLPGGRRRADGRLRQVHPALLMGAATVDLPAVFVPAGPMLPGHWRNEVLGSGTDMWKYWDDKRAGLIGDCEMAELESGLARSPGHCMTMGTASTLTAAAEALGVTVPGASSIPAVDSGHDRMAAASGLRIVELVWQDLKLSQILTAEAYEDAVATVLALGGSTNAVIHLIAMAGRSGCQAHPGRLRPHRPYGAGAGQRAPRRPVPDGGLPLRRRPARVPGPAHRPSCTWTGPTVAHATLREQLDGALVHNADVIRAARQPAGRRGRRGGAARQPLPGRRGHQAHRRRAAPAAATPAPRSSSTTTGRCSAPSTTRRSAITADTVLVLRGAGPAGRPRNARVRHAADPRLPAEAGGAGHGADLRRPDERHQLRRLRPAHRARVATSAARWPWCAPAT